MNSKTTSRLQRLGQFLADYIPTAVIVGLIALYYIQLSHMGQ